MPLPDPDDRRIGPKPVNGQANGGANGSANGSANKRSLSEISRLFLSDFRNRPRGPAGGPTPVTAVIGGHLGGDFPRHAAAHAAGLARGGRVGLAVVGAETLRLELISAADGEDDSVEADPPAAVPAAAVADAAGEMSADVARWVVVLPDVRVSPAKRLLDRCRDWTLLAGADHEGVVGGYRTLKHLAESIAASDAPPRVRLGVVGAADDAEAARAARKLAGVARQFLDVAVDGEADPTRPPARWRADPVLDAAWPGAAAAAGAWEALEAALFPAEPAQNQPNQGEPMPRFDGRQSANGHANGYASHPLLTPDPRPEETSGPGGPVVAGFRVDADSIPPLAQPVPRPPQPAAPSPVASPASPAPPMPLPFADEVIDLPPGGGTAAVVEAAASSRYGDGLAVTPLVPPMLPGSKLCVARDGAAVLVVAAEPGLADLPRVGRAMAWVAENCQLLGLALQQYRLADGVPVRVRLYVSHADAGGPDVRSLLGANADVEVRVYRRLRWGGREGVLLDAA